MNLPNELIKQFVKELNTKTETPKNYMYGVIQEIDEDEVKWVKMDGSDELAPVISATDAMVGDKVVVTMQDHGVIVVGNVTAPASARTATNFLRFDENGLIIGNLSGAETEELGIIASVIKPGSYDIVRMNTDEETGRTTYTRLASFSENEITLGGKETSLNLGGDAVISKETYYNPYTGRDEEGLRITAGEGGTALYSSRYRGPGGIGDEFHNQASFDPDVISLTVNRIKDASHNYEYSEKSLVITPDEASLDGSRLLTANDLPSIDNDTFTIACDGTNSWISGGTIKPSVPGTYVALVYAYFPNGSAGYRGIGLRELSATSFSRDNCATDYLGGTSHKYMNVPVYITTDGTKTYEILARSSVQHNCSASVRLIKIL